MGKKIREKKKIVEQVLGGIFFFLTTYYLGEPRYWGYTSRHTPWLFAVIIVASIIWINFWFRLTTKIERIVSVFVVIVGSWFSPLASALLLLMSLFLMPESGWRRHTSTADIVIVDFVTLIVAFIFVFMLNWLFAKLTKWGLKKQLK